MSNRKQFFQILSTLVLTLGLVAGCGSTASSGDDDGSEDGTGGGNGDGTAAPTKKVDACKQACQKQKFFGCYDAQQHATCFDKCEKAKSDQIETFAGCVGADTCDEECSLDVELGSSSGGDGGGDGSGGSSSSGDQTTSECVSACEGLKSDGCEPFGQVDCSGACENATESQKRAFAYCAGARDKCQFPDECEGFYSGGGNGGGTDANRTQCEIHCQAMVTQGCIEQSKLSTCNTRCNEASAEKVEQFNDCLGATAMCTDDSCYQKLQ